MTRPIITIVYNTCVHVVRSRLRLINALQTAGYDVVVLAPMDEATPRLTENGVAHRQITMSQYGMDPLLELRSIREIRGLLEEIRPVASLHYTVKPNTVGSIAARKAGVPVLNNIAGAGRAFSRDNPLIRKMVIELYRRGLRHSHTVFFQNGEDMAAFREAGLVGEAQCVQIPGSGVDLARFTASPLPDGAVRFLFVGRLLLEKGVMEFLKAANRMLTESADGDNLRFDLVGEYDDAKGYISRDDLEGLTQSAQITYHGVVPPERIDSFVRDATCIVLPSYYGEGVPRVLLEACASGRPIITTNNVGCREVAEPGYNGWMVAPRDAGALTDAMRACVEAGPESLAALGKGARRTVEARFDEQSVLDKYLDRLAMVRNDLA